MFHFKSVLHEQTVVQDLAKNDIYIAAFIFFAVPPRRTRYILFTLVYLNFIININKSCPPPKEVGLLPLYILNTSRIRYRFHLYEQANESAIIIETGCRTAYRPVIR